MPSDLARDSAFAGGAEEIATRIRALDDEDRFVVIDEGPGRLVFIQGYSENAARGWGVRRADVRFRPLPGHARDRHVHARPLLAHDHVERSPHPV